MWTIIFLSVIPVIIWAFMAPLSFRFFDFTSAATSIGQVLGLVGTTLFSLSLILAGRFKFLDRYFKGLDKVYAKHHLIGAVAFSMLLFHPLFLAFNYMAFSLREAALFFTPFVNMPITWGIISLLLMMVLMVATFYIKLKYQIWKFSHKFMVAVFIFATIHTIFISSDISRNAILRYYILGLAAAGLASGAYKVFLSSWLFKKIKYKVKRVSLLGNNIVEIEMEPAGEKLNFKAGQFIFIGFKNGGVSSESHPFSISSGEQDDNLKIVVKSLGDFTSELKNLKESSLAELEGPYGNFYYKNIKNKNQIWVAGGVGITPFLSMARSLQNDYKIDLYYCVKDIAEAVLMEDLQKISQENKNFKINRWCSLEKGFINSGVIANLSNGLVGKDILMCGPAVFMESLEKQFVSLGVNINNIHYEKFNFL